MDLRKYMILIDGEDKTGEIDELFYDRETDKIGVIFQKSRKLYKYNADRIMAFKDPKEIDWEGYVIFVNGMPVYEPVAVLDFTVRVRIIWYHNNVQTVKPGSVQFFKSSAESGSAKQTLAYLKDITENIRDTSPNHLVEPFLKTELDGLTFVHPDSVLSAYLNGEPIRQNGFDPSGVFFPFRFNLSQKAALENALTHSVSVIEGPPGTGKTQTILNIIANLVLAQKSVAVVSNNNEAVKNVSDKLKKDGYGFLCATLGRRENREAFFAHLPAANVENWDYEEDIDWIEQQVVSLNQQLEQLMEMDRMRARYKQERLAWQLEKEHFESYFEHREFEKIKKLPLRRANAKRILSFLAETTLAKEYGLSNTVRHRLRLFFQYGVLHFKKLSQNEVSLPPNLQRAFYERQLYELDEEIAALDRQLRAKSFDKLLKAHQVVSQALFQKCLYQRYHGQKYRPFTYLNYKRDFADFLSAYPVILSTTHALRRSIPENYLLDYVVIDESSQVDLVTGVLALSCCKNVVIVGDPKQLPQITDQTIQERLDTRPPSPVYDYFGQNLLSSIIGLYGKELPREILREHYRCHPSIIEFCNQKYYKGELIPYTSPDLSDQPLVLYKTSEGNHMRRVTSGREKGVYNQRELDVIIEELLSAPEYLEEQEHIGIVTPFRKQANKAKSMLPSQIESDTVHKYQGREKDIMIMSTVLSDTKDGRLRLAFVDDPQMINVAVSRAIRQFILVTDHEMLLKKGKDIGDLIRYMQYSTLDENIIESKIVSIFDLLYQKYASELSAIQARMDPKALQSEEALRVVLNDIIGEEPFDRFAFREQVLLINLLNDMRLLNDEELAYVNDRASCDFVVFYKQDKSCALVIEVDGFAFHENRPDRLYKDQLKDSILRKYGVRQLRLPTNGSGEEAKIRAALQEVLAV